MLEWETSQRKRVIFGQCLRLQILCQTFLKGGGGGVYLSFDLVGFPRAIGALWAVPPPKDILFFNFGNFPFG
jgi:hypothetical protein